MFATKIQRFFYVSFIALLSFNTTVKGQDFAFQQFTVNDGLPSSYLYDIVQDKEGYIWITTEGGLCKYDGHQFIKSPIEGLNQKEVIEIFYDSSDRLWLSDLSNSLSFYKDGILYNLDTMPYPRSQYITKVHEDYQGKHLFINDWIGEITYVNNEDFFNKKAYKKIKDEAFIKTKKKKFTIRDSLDIIISTISIITWQNDEFFIKKYKERNTFLEKEGTDGYPNKDEVVIFSEDKLLLYNIETQTLRLAFTKYSKLFDVGINSLFKEDDEKRIWVSTKDGLVLIQKQEDGTYKFTKHLEGKFVGVVIKDKEGNYWMTTQKDGLYFLPSIEVKTYKSNQFRQVTAINSDKKGNIFLGSDENNVDVLNTDFELQRTERLATKYSEIYDIICTDEETVFLTADKTFIWDSQFRQRTWTTGSFKTGKLGEEGKLWIGTTSDMAVVENDKIVSLGKERTYAVFPTAPNETLFGTVNGLYHYKNEQLTKIDTANLDYDIRDIYVMQDGRYLLATQSDGLIVYHNGVIQKQYTTQNGLSSNTCKKLMVDGEIIWIGTNKGINKIDLKSGEIRTLNDDNGLPNNEINYVHQIDDKLIVATNSGIAYFDKNIALDDNPPNTIITNVKVAEIDTTILDNYELSYTESNVKIEYVGLGFKHAEDIQYQFKMDGLDEEWISTNFNYAQYPALPSGDYTFSLKSKTINSEWSPEQKITFQINKPFWETTWFFILCILLFGLLIAGISQAIINRNKREAEAKRKLKESQLTALRAQMNPHFMYNALNSIQEFIITEDKRSANRYLSQFSHLMRNILSMSDQDKVLVRQEIESLELYLSLEGLRFESNFEYKIEIGEDIDIDHIYIPSMIVQPYVENAIKHGLHHKKGQKSLYIRFIKKEEHLICVVEDNGVGRKRSQEINQNNARLFPSRAMSLTKNRLELIDEAYGKQLNVEITDLKDSSGKPTGTKVTLYIRSTTSPTEMQN